MLLKGTVKLIFQPREGSYVGAAYHVLQTGVLDDINAIFGLHIYPSFPSGVIASRASPVLAG